MAIISRIRKRSGLIAAVIGIALLAFVMGDMLFSGQSLFNSQQNAGEIAGHPISIIAFDNEVQRIADVQKERRQQAALDDESMNSIRDRVWEQYINDLSLKPQFANAGVSVSDAEVKELILGNDADQVVVQYFSDPSSGQLFPFFRDEMTGKLKPSSVKTYVDSLPPQEKPRWAEFEGMVRDERAKNKYLSLIKKGLYITTEQAKQDYANLNRAVNFNYVKKPYSDIADSLVEINDKDKLKFYNENQYKFKQEASRKLEYIVFDIKPTEEDFQEIRTEMERLKEEWAQIKNKKEDSLFVIREAGSRRFDTTYYGKGSLPVQIDSLAQASEKGTVLPMYMENNQYKLSKVTDWIISPDSVKARHILIKVAQGDSLGKAIAKTKIDSIKKVIQNKNNFAEMAKQFSEDEGSKEKAGDLGWFTKGKMVPEFQNASFNGKKGDKTIVLSDFGYHLIEILDQSLYSRQTQVAVIDRTIEPGSKTRQDVYNQAVDFITKYHTAETFDKGVEELNLVKRVADPLKKNDKAVTGIDNSREIVRWTFNNEKGTVSTEPFNLTGKYVVALVSEIREEGVADISQKEEEVTIGAKKMKKAEKIIADINNITASALEDLASKLNTTINTAEGATFSSYSIPQVGREVNLYGPLFSMKEGEISKPVAGESGVFVLKVDKVIESPATTDYTGAKTQAKNNITYRADVEVIEAIKKSAEIKDNRAKYF